MAQVAQNSPEGPEFPTIKWQLDDAYCNIQDLCSNGKYMWGQCAPPSVCDPLDVLPEAEGWKT